MGPLRTRHRRHHCTQIQFQVHAVIDLPLGRNSPEILRLVVVLERHAKLFRTACPPQIRAGLLVDREKAHGGTVFGRHVGDGGAVHHRERLRAWSVELHKFSDHLRLSKHLGDVQHQVGGRHSLAEGAREMHTHHLGRQEVNRLSQHPCLGFDPAHSPAHHAQTVDHRGVGIGPHQRVGKINTAPLQNPLGQILQIDLMHDPNSRRHHTKRLECLLAPLQQFIPLPVPLELQIHVPAQGGLGPEIIHLHAVIDHQVDRNQRLDHLRVTAHPGHRGTHRRQIHQQRHPSEILQHHPGNHKRDFHLGGRLGVPIRQPAHILLGHLLPIAIAEHGLQHDSNADWQPRNWANPLLFECRQGMKLPGLATADWERLECLEEVAHVRFKARHPNPFLPARQAS